MIRVCLALWKKKNLPPSCQCLVLSQFWILAALIGVQGHLVLLICISPMASAVTYLLIRGFPIPLSFLMWYLPRPFVHLLTQGFVFLLLNLNSALYILVHSPL